MASFGTKHAIDTATFSEWLREPASLAISRREAHVWKVDISARMSTEAREILSLDELDRAARFHFENDRERFKAAHVALRLTLGRYLDLPAERLVFGRTDFGKPFLINHEAHGLLFNMSHSGDVALIAVARDREVGIDVEYICADFATNEVAEHFFSVAEIYTLSGLDQHQRTRAFFNCWTRKEAYVKARGEGLSMTLDQFDVSLAPGSDAAMLGNRLDESEKTRWSFQDLRVAPDYAAALVVESLESPPNLSLFTFT